MSGLVGGRRVLVVEDEALVAMALCNDLAARGWTIVGPAASVEEAVLMLSDTSPPDVAVLDVNLGGGFVYPLAERLRTRRRAVRILHGLRAARRS